MIFIPQSRRCSPKFSQIHQSIGWYLCSLQELNAVTSNPSYNDNPNGKQPQSATIGANHPRVAANLGMVWSTDINSISYVTYENGTLPSFSRTHLISMCPWIIGFTPIIRSYPMSMVDKTRDFSPFKWGKEPLCRLPSLAEVHRFLPRICAELKTLLVKRRVDPRWIWAGNGGW